MDKISVIIPVYNVEKYLSECLDSVIGQTYANLEIILVDDGSTDTSGVLCDEYAKKDERIKVIHKPNGGVSSARNVALKEISGKYFAFIDSDDVVLPEYLQTLYTLLTENDCEASFCSYTDRIENLSSVGETDVFGGRELMDKIVNGQRDLSVLWGKLFLFEKFKTFVFPNYAVGEDEVFVNQTCLLNKVCYVRAKMYFYRTNPEGLINGGFSLSKLSALEALEIREKFLLENGFDEFVYQNRKNILYKIIFLYFECKKAGFKGEAKALKQKFKVYFDKMNPSFNKKDSFRLKLFKFCPFLYKTVTGLNRRIKCRKK